jgi:amino acid transporter
VTEAKPLGARDTLLFTLAMNVGLPWIAVAAVAGPSSLLLWLLALTTFFVPLAVSSLELTARFAGEGGIYGWVRGTFGEFAGFMCGWIYWTSNVPFFATTLYSLVTALALVRSPQASPEALSPMPIMWSCIGVALVVLLLQLRGLGVGKWITNAGGAAVLAMLAVIVAGGIVFAGSSATDFSKASYVPPFSDDTAILWATMVFAYCGVEGLAFLRADINGGMRSIVRATIFLGIVIATLYILGTVAMLVIVPADELSRATGLPQALQAGANRLGWPGLGPVMIVASALAMLGSYGAWFRVAAQLPFLAGVDHYLPEAFGRRSANGAPTYPLLLQAAVVIVLVVLSQAGGASVRAAYDFLISITVLPIAIAYLFLFAAYVRIKWGSEPAGFLNLPGGVVTGRLIALTGFLATLVTVICTLVPSPDEPDKGLAIAKLVAGALILIASGVGVYVLGKRRADAVRARGAA